MKNLILLVAIFFASSIIAYSSNDSIAVVNTLLWHNYYIDSNQLSRNEVSDILNSNQFSKHLIKQSKAYKTIGYICLTGTLASTGFIVSDAIKSKEATGRLPLSHSFAYAVSITSGVLVLGVASLTISNRKFQRAIKIYNSKMKGRTVGSNLGLDIGINYINLTYRF